MRLAEAAPITGGLRFELAEEEGWSEKEKAVPRRGPKVASRRRR